MKAGINRTWRYLQSRTLALVLLGLVFVGIALGWALRLDWVLSSWAFLTTVALLLLNTLACSINRISQLLSRTTPPEKILSATSTAGVRQQANIKATQPPTEVAPIVVTAFQRRGYRVTTSGDDGSNIFAEKGRPGEWGSIVFHLSFIVLLIGVIISSLTRYEGVMILTEGQTLTDKQEDYLLEESVPDYGGEHLGFQIRLDGFRPTYHQGSTPVNYVANLTILEDERIILKDRVRVNEPLVYKGTSFVLKRYGFAPRFILMDADGEELFNSFINLRVISEHHEDSFTVPDSDFTVRTIFYPDLKTGTGQVQSESLIPKNPVMSLHVTRGESTLFDGMLPIGESAQFDDKTLSFTELRYWTQYLVVKDGGEPVVIIGLWLSVLGISLRFLYSQKRLQASIINVGKTTDIAISGKAVQLGWLYREEFANIVTSIEKEVA